MALNLVWVGFILVGFGVALLRTLQGDLAIFSQVLTGPGAVAITAAVSSGMAQSWERMSEVEARSRRGTSAVAERL